MGFRLAKGEKHAEDHFDDADDDEDVGSLALACIHLHPIASTQRAPVKAPLQVSLNSRPTLQVANIG